ncbi:MAG: cobalamin-dependent protein, partial [Proteobacteria bacterium]|nr:cobalamin-dependent protein [Pseudomonadota bacterium]
MKKIALISPYEDISSLGVRTLSAYLKKRGIHTSIIHVIPVIEQEQKYVRARDDSYNIEALKKLIAQLDPDFVGASCMTNYFRRVARMLDELRGMVPLRLMGGIHPTIRPEECLEHADIVCLGEAEETLFELIQIGDTLTASRLRAVKGIGFWDEGKKVTTELRPLVDDLDKYHPIDFSFSDEFVISKGKTERVNINNALQLLPKFPFNKSMFRCNASRGCPFSCSYCCNNTLKKMWKGNGKYIRWRSVDNVINELIYAKEAICIESIRFMDDSFLHLPVEWISDF